MDGGGFELGAPDYKSSALATRYANSLHESPSRKQQLYVAT